MLHGWARSLRDFDDFLPMVSEMVDSPWIVRFDLPGFASSPIPTAVMNSHQYAQVVRDGIVEAISNMPVSANPRVIVIGHSFGGKVALCLGVAEEIPFQLSGLVLSGAPLLRHVGTIKKPKLEFRIARFFARFGIVSASRMDKLRDKYGSRDYRAAQGLMRDIFVCVVNEDCTNELSRLTIPVTLLWGRHDTGAPLVIAEKARELSPELVDLKVVDGDHFVAILNPMVLLDAIESLVQRIGS